MVAVPANNNQAKATGKSLALTASAKSAPIPPKLKAYSANTVPVSIARISLEPTGRSASNTFLRSFRRMPVQGVPMASYAVTKGCLANSCAVFAVANNRVVVGNRAQVANAKQKRTVFWELPKEFPNHTQIALKRAAARNWGIIPPCESQSIILCIRLNRRRQNIIPTERPKINAAINVEQSNGTDASILSLRSFPTG